MSVPQIAVVVGSESDLPTVLPVLEKFSSDKVRIVVHVMSCHRNPREVMEFCVEDSVWLAGLTAIVCAGSKAFALPGVIDAWLYANGVEVLVIGVALGNKDAIDFTAACLSISCLPGTPVVTDEIGNCYRGPEGLEVAINRVIAGQLPAPKKRTAKPVQVDVWKNY